MCKLSIIVPVYNMASDGKLDYCLNSLLNQTISDYEIIAVDDKSTDNSLEVLHNYEKQYPGKFRVIESAENGRQGAARNKGIIAAKGEYLGFIDADDWVLPDTYECAVKKAEETGADSVGFDLCIVHEHTMIPTERVPSNSLEQAGITDKKKRSNLLLNSGSFSTKIYKREILLDPLFQFPEKIAYEDNAITVDIIMRIKHFEYIPEAKYFYYQHGQSTTHSISQKNIEDRMTSMRFLLNTAKKWDALSDYYNEVECIFARCFYATTLFSYMQSKIKHEVRFIKKLGREVKAEFPGFLNNPFFVEALDKEELMWVKLQQKSSLLFYLYYNLKKFYRMKRYGKW